MMMVQQIITFIGNHWMLVALFVVLLGLVLGYEISNALKSVPRVSPQAAAMLINRKNALVLDVRDVNGFKENHIAGSLNIPATELVDQIKKLQKHQKNSIIVCCGFGHHSPVAAQQLRKLGFEDLYILRGGTNAWQGAGMPLVKE